MKTLGLRCLARYVSVAAALLAGCGRPEPPVVVPGGTPVRQAGTSSAAELLPALKRFPGRFGYKVTGSLLFVTNPTATYNDVRVYNARAKDATAPLATISDGIDTPGGVCVDGHSTLYVVNGPNSSG